MLVETAPERAAEVATRIEDGLSDFGGDATSTAERLARFHRVENTYLSTFQTLGGLGLLLGTVGLATVLLRNVLERRRELALLGAVGYRRGHFLLMVAAENTLLLAGGLARRSCLRGAGHHARGHRARRPAAVDERRCAAAVRGVCDRPALVAGRHAGGDAIAPPRIAKIRVVDFNLTDCPVGVARQGTRRSAATSRQMRPPPASSWAPAAPACSIPAPICWRSPWQSMRWRHESPAAAVIFALAFTGRRWPSPATSDSPRSSAARRWRRSGCRQTTCRWRRAAVCRGARPGWRRSRTAVSRSSRRAAAASGPRMPCRSRRRVCRSRLCARRRSRDSSAATSRCRTWRARRSARRCRS